MWKKIVWNIFHDVFIMYTMDHVDVDAIILFTDEVPYSSLKYVWWQLMTTLLVDIDDSQQACWHYSAKFLISVVLYSYFPTRPVQRSLPSKKIDQHQHANSSIAPSIQIRWSLCIFHSLSLRFILKASQNRAEWLNDNDSMTVCQAQSSFFSQIAKKTTPVVWGKDWEPWSQFAQ